MARNAVDQSLVSTLGNAAAGGLLCFGQHAIAPGASENNTQSQISKALAYWQNLDTAGLDSTHAAAVNDAITYLTSALVYAKNPGPNVVNPYDR